MGNVNKQLLDALKGLLEFHDNPAPFSGKTGEERMFALENQAAKRNALIYSARQAIAAAERAQQAELVENAKLANAIQQADLAEVAAEAERRQAYPGRQHAVGFFSGWVEGGEDGQPVEFMVTAYGDVPPVGAKLYTEPPAQQQAEPVAWLKYPRKKPELMQVSLSKHLPVALKNSGWVSEPLYAHPPAVADTGCKFPLCQNEQYQKDLAEQLHRDLYAGAQQAAVAVPDEVAKDAARYRWLRQDESEFSSMAPAELDAAIDKAIAAQKGGQ